jgi:hypothetical protein
MEQVQQLPRHQNNKVSLKKGKGEEIALLEQMKNLHSMMMMKKMKLLQKGRQYPLKYQMKKKR